MAHIQSPHADIELTLHEQMQACTQYLILHTAGPRQCSILRLLQENGPMTQKQLQTTLGILPGTVSEMVSKLAAKGFLTRQRNPLDKRIVLVTLTEQGESLRIDPETQLSAPSYATLTRAEQRQLSTLLTRLLSSWEGED